MGPGAPRRNLEGLIEGETFFEWTSVPASSATLLCAYSSGMTTDLNIRLDGFTLSVRDIERSVAFYRDMFGFAVEQMRGKAFALLRLGNVTLGLLAESVMVSRGVPALDEAQHRNFELELTTDDLDATYATLQARGVVFRGPPETKPWERSVQASDPDGYTIEIAQGLRGHNAPAR